MKTALFAVVGLAMAASVNAAVVTQYDFTGTNGDQAFQAPSAAASHITGLNITRGAGLGVSAAGTCISSLGWTGEASDYFAFGFTVESGYKVDLSSFVASTRSSNTAPGTFGLYYSGNSFAAPLYTFNQSGTNFTDNNFDLSALTALTGNVEFRIIAIGTNSANGGTTASTGTFRIGGTINTTATFNGTVSLVPAPGSAALLGLGGLVATRRRRA